MVSTNSQGSEGDCEMEAVDLSTPPMQEDGEGKSKGIVLKLGELLDTVGEKLAAIRKVVVESKWVKEYVLAKDGDTTRVYQVWQGNNVFFFHGRVVCGPDPRGLLLTSVSIIVSSWLFTMYNEDDDLPVHPSLTVCLSLLLTISVLVNLFLVSATDPGIIARNDETGLVEETEGSRRKRVITINGVEFKIKYCRICKIFRPPRSCHCAVCNNCVEKYDHHCPWIGQCIALRNYRFYVTFVISALSLFIYIFICSIWRIRRRMLGMGVGLARMLMDCPETVALILFSFAAICFLGCLAVFQLYLISTNQTAYENIRECYKGCGNPFDKGILRNIKEVLFSPLPPSRVYFHAQVTPRECLNAAAEREA